MRNNLSEIIQKVKVCFPPRSSTFGAHVSAELARIRCVAVGCWAWLLLAVAMAMAVACGLLRAPISPETIHDLFVFAFPTHHSVRYENHASWGHARSLLPN